MGLGTVSVPIIIHLLNRRRFKTMDWAAMKFLLESVHKNRRRLRIEELILLALRCLILFLLALALARFTGCAATDVLPVGGKGSRIVVFVLDDSYSMAQKLGAGTLFSAAKKDLAGKLEELSETDRVAILRTSRSKAGKAFFSLNFITDKSSLLERLKELEVSDLRTGLAESLTAAVRVFDEVEAGNKRLYVLSDFRSVDLAPPEQAHEIRRWFGELRKREVDVVTMDYGRAPASNLTVESLRLLNRFAVSKAPTALRIALTVRNNGPARAEQVEVKIAARLKSGGEYADASLPMRTLEGIEPGESRTIEIPFSPGESGSAFLTVKLPADDLLPDNVAQIALDVREALRVLVVDGRVDLTDPEESESFFFVRALDPNDDSGYGNTAEVVSAEAMNEVDFQQYDLVVLLNVSEFPSRLDKQGRVQYPKLQALERYVRSDGGLAIFTGEKVNPAFYNGPLYKSGQGLSPFKIGVRKGNPEQIEEFFQLDPNSIGSERFLRIFQGEAAGFTKLIRFTAFHTTEERVVPSINTALARPRVLARFTDAQNSPAIVARRFGRGRTLMFYTTASKRWNDWPIEIEIGTYVSVIQGMVGYLARPQSAEYTRRVGEPIVFELSGRLRDAQGALRTPNPDEDDQAPGFKFDVLAERIRRLCQEMQRSGCADANAVGQSLGDARQRCAAQDAFAFKQHLDDIAGLLAKVDTNVPGVRLVREKLNAELSGQWQQLLRREFHAVPTSAGVYTIRLKLPDGESRQVFFARNTEPVEGRLAPGRQKAITSAFGSGDFIYVDRSRTQAVQTVELRDEKEYWLWALVAMLVLLAVETFLAQRFGHYT